MARAIRQQKIAEIARELNVNIVPLVAVNLEPLTVHESSHDPAETPGAIEKAMYETPEEWPE
jgi:hypothetical protein